MAEMAVFHHELNKSATQLKQDVSRGAYSHMPAHDPCILSHSLASPDEYPFTSNLPKPVLPPLVFPKILHPNKINANPSILLFYTRAIAPRITRHATLDLATRKRANGISGDEEFEDDGNYGSAATIDVEVLHAISKRVHYGMRIAATHVRVDDNSRYRQICFGIKVPGESQRVYTAYS